MFNHHVLRDPVLLALLAASLVAWVIIADRVLLLIRVVRADAAVARGKDIPAAPLARLREELQRHVGIDRERLLLLMDAAVTRQRQRLEVTLPLLGVIGSTAPYVGLLGTVIGIIQAFQAIQAHNNMTPAVVGGGIATALIATASGLAVAIPAVAAHHLLSAAISRRVAYWEGAITEWLPEDGNSTQLRLLQEVGN